jgi:hypothetical protein
MPNQFKHIRISLAIMLPCVVMAKSMLIHGRQAGGGRPWVPSHGAASLGNSRIHLPIFQEDQSPEHGTSTVHVQKASFRDAEWERWLANYLAHEREVENFRAKIHGAEL